MGASAHSDFPLSVDLSNMPAAFWQNVSTACTPGCDQADIIVTTSDHLTKLNREIGYIIVTDAITGTGEGTLYFKDPSLSEAADETYWIYFGNAGATEQNAQATLWVNYAVVFHFDEASIPANPTQWCNVGQTGVLVDSTGQSNECIYKNGAPLAAQAGVMGRSVYLDGIDDRFYIYDPGTTPLSMTTSGAIQVQIMILAGSDDNSPLVQKHRNNTSSIEVAGNMEYFLAFQSGKWRAGVSSDISAVAAQGPVYSTWQVPSYRWGTAPGRHYLTDTTAELIDASTSKPSLTNWHFHIGYRTVADTTQRLIQAYYDEIRISNTNRTAEWLQTDNYILANNAAFWTNGAAEGHPLPGPLRGAIMVVE